MNFFKPLTRIVVIVLIIIIIPLIILFHIRFRDLVISNGDYLLALVEVNKKISLGRYVPKDLVSLADLGFPDKYVRSVVYKPLQSLLLDARKEGLHIIVISAYRSYDQQKVIYYTSKTKRGHIADYFSARPEHSEHQLGTAIDFGNGGIHDLKVSFADTPEGKWLNNNAYKYGFVLSYPRDSARITGYIYEPWHFRFIGLEAALEWKKSGLVLEEYLATKPQSFK